MYQSVTLVTDGNTSDNPRKKNQAFLSKDYENKCHKVAFGYFGKFLNGHIYRFY